ncbi:MAG: radical SAM protein [Myxococcales bacterium]|nr:MAG: radical SAM protein [Myxococcales bacterium]
MTALPIQNWRYEAGPIRPPSEACSLLVRLTRNCPWGRCRFCISYRGAAFEARSLEDVRSDIDAMAEIARFLLEESWRIGTGGRITHEVLNAAAEAGLPTQYSYQVALFLSAAGQSAFLTDADSLSLPVGDVEAALKHLYSRFPSLRRVTTYARSMTLCKLGAENLRRLREAGLTRVHVGMESGSDAVLKEVRKGVLAKHHIAAGRAAMEAGLELSEYIMPGLGGRERSAEHAGETARVLNAINPQFIRLRTFTPLPGSALEEELAEGGFTPLDEDGVVAEIRAMIAALDGISSQVVSDHDWNLLMEVEGRIPDDKPAMLSLLDAYLSLSSENRQLFRVGRRLGILHFLADLQRPPARRAAEEAAEDLKRRFGDAEAGLRAVAPFRM